MLVLSREVGQRIVIDGGRIVVELIDIKGCCKARIGITADPSISIHREEVQSRIEREERGHQ